MGGQLPASSATVHRALSFWTRLQGVLSLELAGHLTPMGFDPGLLLAEEVERSSDQYGETVTASAPGPRSRRSPH